MSTLGGTPRPGGRAIGQAIGLDEALDLTRTGDVWIFRGRSAPDRAIRLLTNAPVNHVGMAVVLSDLPPLMWHAELGQSLVDVWTGGHHRGAQLHDLREAVLRWTHVYEQQAFLRQLHPTVERDHEDALLRSIARYNGTSFPSTAQLAWRWAKGRRGPMRWLPERARLQAGVHRGWEALIRRPLDPVPEPDIVAEVGAVRPDVAYCAEVVALSYEAMGVLTKSRPPSWYDPGRFWSGDQLPLVPGWVFGAEIRVDTGPGPAASRRSRAASRRRSRWVPRVRRAPITAGLGVPPGRSEPPDAR